MFAFYVPPVKKDS